jgi:hypothetical protein
MNVSMRAGHDIFAMTIRKSTPPLLIQRSGVVQAAMDKDGQCTGNVWERDVR